MGKPKYIETPEKMWEYFEAYRKEVKSNPIKKHVFVGKDGVSDFEQRERPLTIEGFELYLMNKGIINDVSDYFENKEQRYTNYIPICRAIRKTVREDQISGGMAGIYNPSITQQLNGLTDKSEMVVKEQPLFGDDK